MNNKYTYLPNIGSNSIPNKNTITSFIDSKNNKDSNNYLCIDFIFPFIFNDISDFEKFCNGYNYNDYFTLYKVSINEKNYDELKNCAKIGEDIEIDLNDGLSDDKMRLWVKIRKDK